jgi:hypothetical protein
MQQLRNLLWTARVLGAGQLRKLRHARQAGLVNLARGHSAVRVISTLFNVGFFGHVQRAGSVDPDAYAAANGLDPHILRALCDYLYALRFLKKQGTGYALDTRGALVVDTLQGLFESSLAYEDVFHHLEPLLRQEMRYGVEVTRNSEFTARGSGSGARLFSFPLVADLIQRGGFKRPLDLACGDAPFLVDLCRRNPDVTAYGVDIAPEAIAYGEKQVAAAHLQDRIHLFAEDIFQIHRIAGQLHGVDVVTSFYGFQEFLGLGKDKLLGLLDDFRRLFPGVTFIVCEIPKYSPDELRKFSGGIVEYQLVHALTHQRLATREEWMALWREARFQRIDERYLDFARTAIYTLS